MVPYLTRHRLTLGEHATVIKQFGELRRISPPEYIPGRVVEAVKLAIFRDIHEPDGWDLDDVDPDVAIAAPTWVILELVLAGWRVIEFDNIVVPKERAFVETKGAWLHTRDGSEYYPCPLSWAEQEADALTGLPRG